MENTKRNMELGKSIRFVLAVAAVMLAVICMPIGVNMVRAKAAVTQYTVTETTIKGTVGTPIEPQTIEINVENGKFDLEQFYIGKDVSDYFNEQFDNNALYGGQKQYTNSAYVPKRYFLPIGLKVVITEASETKLKCTVSGTPISPCDQPIKVWFRRTMYSEYTQNQSTDVFPEYKGNETAYWDVKYATNDMVSKNKSCSLKCSKNEKEFTGKAGETEFDIDFTMSLTKAVFMKDMPKGTDVSNWFGGSISESEGYTNQLPVGMTAVLTSDVKFGDTSCTFKISGKPEYGSKMIVMPIFPDGQVARGDASYKWDDKSDRIWMVDESGQFAYFKFNITALDEEPAYIAPSRNNVVAYTGLNYTTEGGGDLAKFSFTLHNGKWGVNPDPGTYPNVDRSNIPGASDAFNDDTTYLYTNTEGKLDKEAEGFLYSTIESTDRKIIVNQIGISGSYATQTSFSVNAKGTFTKPGEYDLTYFVPLSMLEGNSDQTEGYTKVVKSGAKLILIKPVQLEVDDSTIELKVGETVKDDTFITVKTSYLISKKDFDSSITTQSLKYTVSDELKSHGLSLVPVAVNKGSVVFKLTGTVTGKAANINLADCVTFDSSDFADLNARYSPVAVNANQDAKLIITGQEGDIVAKEYDRGKEDPDAPDIWVNGKDDKKLKSYAKTFTLDGKLLVSSIPSGCKAIVSVTDTKVDSHEDAFSNGKGQKSSVAKASYKQGKVVVTAGKTEGTARVWLAAYDSKKKLYKACGYFDIVVGTAPKKIILTSNPSDDPEATKAVTVVKSDKEDCYQTLYAYASGSELSKYSTFIWTKSKDNNLLELVPSDDTHCCVIKVKSAPTGGKAVKASVEAVCVESGKKFKCTVLIENPVREIKGLSKEIKIESAKESAKTKEFKISLVGSDSKQPITDKVKVLVTSNIKEHEGWTSVEGSNKIKLSEPSKNIKASYKDGTLTIKVSKGTEDGTQAKLIFVYTGAGKDSGGMDESYIVTVG